MGQDLSELTVAALRELAKKRGLSGFSKLKKAELIELLTSSEGTGADGGLDDVIEAMPDGNTEIKMSHVFGFLVVVVPIMFVVSMCVGTDRPVPEGNRVVDRCANSPEATSTHEQKKIRKECREQNLNRQFEFSGVVADIGSETGLFLELNAMSDDETIAVVFNEPIDGRVSVGDEVVLRGLIYLWDPNWRSAAQITQPELVVVNGDTVTP